jgi:hypothetical protein
VSTPAPGLIEPLSPAPPPRADTVATRRSVLPLLAMVVFLAFGLLGAIAADEPLLAIAMPLLGAFIFVAYRFPLRITATALLLAGCFFEGLQGNLAYDWSPPFMGVARLVMANLNSVTGIGILRLPLLDLMTLVLWALSAMRRDEPGFMSRTGIVRPLKLALLASALAVLGLDMLGTVQGGDFNESLWQLRQTLLYPLRTLVLLRAFDATVRDIRMVMRGLIFIAVVKSLIGIYFIHFVVRPIGGDVEFTTSHSDSMLFVPVLAWYFNELIERFNPRTLFRGMFWVPIVTYGMICNDRRLAYVSLAIAVLISLILAPNTRFKVALLRTVGFGLPVFIPYVLLGWDSTGGALFGPARLARSIIAGDPAQAGHADYRDVENVNVLYSWSQNPIVPSGFGHKMLQLFPLPDISSAMPMWQFHPHNQYLWFFAIGGPVGFTLMILPQALTLYLYARTYRFATEPTARAWCLTGMAIIAAFYAQMYGDMGTLSFTPSWMAALAAAMAGKLAVRTGAWPSAKRAVPAPASQERVPHDE